MIISSGLMLLPTNVALDAEHDDDDLNGRPSAEVAATETENVSAPDINEVTRDLAPQTQRKTPVRFQHIAHGAIKPLIAMLASQYVIVAALVAGSAMTVAHYASRAIHEKFAAIVSALERF